MVTKFTGVEAVHEFVHEFCYEWTLTDFEYSQVFQAKQISLLTNSFELIYSRLHLSYLDKTLKTQFEQKLKFIYLYKFHDEIKQILKRCEDLGKEDPLINELKQFYTRYSSIFNS